MRKLVATLLVLFVVWACSDSTTGPIDTPPDLCYDTVTVTITVQDTLPAVQDTLPVYQDTLPPVQDTLPAVQDTLPPYQDTVRVEVFDTVIVEIEQPAWIGHYSYINSAGTEAGDVYLYFDGSCSYQRRIVRSDGWDVITTSPTADLKCEYEPDGVDRFKILAPERHYYNGGDSGIPTFRSTTWISTSSNWQTNVEWEFGSTTWRMLRH